MHFQYVPYIWPFLASAAVTLALAVYALRHREVRGAFPFALCMLLTALWSGGYALETAGADLPTTIFWVKAQCLSYSINPLLWLIMVFQFIERDHWITKRNILFMLILPLLTVALAWTNDLHGLMWQEIYFADNGAFPVATKTFGSWFWLIAAYSYFLNIISEFLLALSLRRKSALYREQSLALFIGLALLFLQNALYISGHSPLPGYDLTSAAAGVSGLIIAWGIFRYRLFNIVPVARDNIIENMADGLIVLDAQNRIADLNLTAKTIFGSQSGKAIGQESAVFFQNQPAFAETGFDQKTPPRELVVQNGDCPKTFEVSYFPLQDRRGRQTGLTIILRDVTERRMAQAKLLEQERTLAMSEERERLARDLHDNLGQVFGFINVQAQGIKQELAKAGIDIASSKLERLVEVARSGHQEMRDYIHSVKSAAADKHFIPAVKKEIEQYIRQTGIQVKLLLTEEPLVEGLEPDVKKHIANIAKEALNNIRKHAEAKNVVIEIKAVGKEILAVIEDDGKGFAAEKPEKEPASGLGLNIMRERTREIGGELRIDSAPGKGTRISLSVPLKGVKRIVHENHAGG